MMMVQWNYSENCLTGRCFAWNPEYNYSVLRIYPDCQSRYKSDTEGHAFHHLWLRRL